MLSSKTFQGNYDRSTAVTRLLYEAVQARFIRVYPKTQYGGTCLRLELYGVTKQGKGLSIRSWLVLYLLYTESVPYIAR